MSVEKFLHLWSAHNTAIIGALIVLILLFVVILAYQTFFGPDEQAPGASMNAELEKTLQRLLENQTALAPASPGAAPAGSSAELELLKGELAEKEKMIEALKAQGAAGAAAPPVDDGEKAKLQERVKDLEARLAEYEIISEDIADLSFYKEENAKLQKELQSRTAGEATPAAAPPAVADAPAEPVPAAAPVAEAPPAPAAPAPAAAEVAAPAAAEEKTDTAALMKEMASAVAATPPIPPAPPNTDDAKLMNQFEDFVKKG